MAFDPDLSDVLIQGGIPPATAQELERRIGFQPITEAQLAAGGVRGAGYQLADGANVGARLIWDVPSGSSNQLGAGGCGPSPLTPKGPVMAGMPVADQAVRGGEDYAADVQRVSDSGVGTRITTATTTVIFMGRGVLKRLYIPTALAGIVTIYDNISAAAPIHMTLPVGTVGFVPLGVECATGCTIVTAAADQVVAVHGK